MKTFAVWMEEALYGPQGYYAAGLAKSGREGDYFTAPDVGPAFGMLLSAIFQQWAQTFAAKPFHLIECGAGEGKLAQAILSASEVRRATSDLPDRQAGVGCRTDSMPYIAVERSPARQEKLRAIAGMDVFGRLGDIPGRPLTGCIFANELIDAMPVHRVRMKDQKLQEAYVESGSWIWDKPSTDELEDYFRRLNILLPEGYETEVNLGMREWMRDASAALSSGFVVLIDYGRPAWEYFAEERNGGTLRMFKDHVVRRLGTVPGMGTVPVDITCDVDFTSLAMDGIEAGLKPIAFMELGTFLMNGARTILDQGDFKAKAPAGLRYLVHPEGMGSAFHVLIMGKNIEVSDWPFEGNRLSRLGLSTITES